MSVSRRMFFKLQKRLEIPTVRLNQLGEEAKRQAVVDSMSKDVTQGNGPNFLRHELHQENIYVSR